MGTYRTAIVGGRRGVHHARCYAGIENMKVIAICEIDEERLKVAVEELNIPGYTDYVEMLEKEKPDIVHAVTEPTGATAHLGRTCCRRGWLKRW